MKTWQERAEELKFDENISWTKIEPELQKEFPKINFNTIRQYLRSTDRYKQKKEFKTTLEVIDVVKKGATLKEIVKSTGLSERMVSATIDDLKDQGFNIELSQDGKYNVSTVIDETAQNIIKSNWNGEKIIRFGLKSDAQINSKFTQITHLHSLYDWYEREGLKKVYDAGDIDEGEQMRPGHQYECYNQGADDHIDEIVRVYPERKGMETDFITGNHDHSFIKRVGLDIGKRIAERRKDMNYLGQSSALIYLTPKCTLELRHPIDGTAYAISYKTQKMIEAMSGGEKPNILAVGHYHKIEYIFYRNVHCFQTGCTQAQTSWMRGKQISAHMGGWIVEVHVNDEGEITRLKYELMPFYKAIKDDYKNWQ